MDILLKIFVVTIVDNNRYDFTCIFQDSFGHLIYSRYRWKLIKILHSKFFFFLNIQITCQFFTWNHETCANMLSKHTQFPKYFSKNQFIKLILQFKHSCHKYFYMFSQFFSLCIFDFYRKLWYQLSKKDILLCLNSCIVTYDDYILSSVVFACLKTMVFMANWQVNLCNILDRKMQHPLWKFIIHKRLKIHAIVAYITKSSIKILGTSKTYYNHNSIWTS